MDKFIKAFVRDSYGVWLCVHRATLDLPSGRISVAPGSKFTRGTRFMDVDLAEILDAQYEKEQQRR